MALSDKSEFVGRAFGWGVLVLSAVFAADLSASELDRHLQSEPEPVNVSAHKNRRSVSSSGELASLFNAEANEADEADTPAAGSEADPEAPPDNAEGLEGAVLQGTLMNGGFNAAVLEQGGEAKVVLEGSQIGDFVLAQVSPSWVYFRSKDGAGKGVRLTLESSVDPEGMEDEASDEPKADDQKKKDAPPEDSEPVKEKLSIDDIRAALNDTAKISSQVRVVPISRDDQPYGTRLVFRKPDNIMSSLGLKDEDILLSVNGNPARSVEDMYQGYMTIRNAKDLEFVVDRGGKKETVRYELATK